MKAKKVLALLLATSMSLSLMACGGTSEPAADATADTKTDAAASTTTDTAKADASSADASTDTAADAEDLEDVIPEETVTLDVYSQLANYSGEQIGWFGQIMLEKFNVKLNIINDPDGVYETRMESGDLGDIVLWVLMVMSIFRLWKKDYYMTGMRMIFFLIMVHISKSICHMR